jgi:hemerythrin
MKVTVLLRNDHEGLMGLVNKYKKSLSSRSNGKKDVVDEIVREVRIHAQTEREIFYAALTESSLEEGVTIVSKAEEQLRAIEKLVSQLNASSGSDKNSETTMISLMEQIVQHIELDEEVFEAARKILPEVRLEELGLEMEDRRKILVTLAA